MELIADGLLIATALAAGMYCMVLSRRLRHLTQAGDGIGPQIEALDKALARAGEALVETRAGVEQLRNSARSASVELAREVARAEKVAAEMARNAEAGAATLQRLYEAERLIGAQEDDEVEPASSQKGGRRVELPGNGDAAEVAAMDAASVTAGARSRNKNGPKSDRVTP